MSTVACLILYNRYLSKQMFMTKVVKAPPKKALPIGRSVRVESGEIFIIQKDIPILGVRSMGTALRYPFGEMQAGESFEIKSNPKETRKMVSRISSACVSYVKRSNKAAKFTVRRTSDQSIRVWRIK